jgi:murein DD-endopeptidase MepM/ murein hydrolase activator NlpD
VSSTAPAKPADATVQTYTYPVGKTVVQKYNEDPVYCDTTQDWRAHTGVDLSAGAGETVKAIADGTVKKVYRDDQYGNTVVVTHGDVEAWYRGLDEMSVKEGASVKQGQKIGTVGVVPVENKEASHLHLEIRKNGKYVDPLTVLQ